MQNAARALVTGNRPFTDYTGQRIADYDQGYGQATGIMTGMQQSGPMTYNQTQFGPGVSYNPTQFQQGAAYNPVGYNQTQLREGPGYTGPTYDESGGNYSGGIAGGAYQNQTIAPREFSQAEVDKYMSPYIKDVLGAAVDQANTQYDRNAAVMRLKDARGGNYGSYGSRVSEAVRDAEQNRNINSLVYGGMQDAYNNATGLMQSWRDAAMRGDELTMNDRQFGAGLGLQDAQFGADLRLRNSQDLNRLRQSDSQFGADLGLQERQRLNDLAMQDNQFGANFAAQQAQFGATLSQQDRQQLNDLLARENQFGATLSQQERARLDELRARESQFGAGFNLDSQNQFYNQQSGIASYLRDEADRRMRYDQANLDQRYQDFLDNRDWDQNQISWLTSILYGVPGSVQNNYQNVYSNPLAQGIGAAGALSDLIRRDA